MKRSLEKEMMDLPGNPPHLLKEELNSLRTINWSLGAYRGLLRCLKQLMGGRKKTDFSLLDVGTGLGDITVTIVQWARQNGISTKVVGLESHPIIAEMARQHTRNFPEISIVCGDGFHPPFPPSSFDFVFTSQVLHHFSEEEIIRILKTWSKLARRGVMVSDLIRHPIAYHGICLFTFLFTRNPMTRTDGPLSVKRAFTLKEWKELFSRAGIGEFHLSHLFPFRIFTLFSVKG